MLRKFSYILLPISIYTIEFSAINLPRQPHLHYYPRIHSISPKLGIELSGSVVFLLKTLREYISVEIYFCNLPSNSDIIQTIIVNSFSVKNVVVDTEIRIF